MFAIPESVHDKIKRAFRHLKINRLGTNAMDSGKRPENPAVHNEPLRLRAVGLQVVGKPGHPAAVFAVERRAAPERQIMSE